LHNTSDDAVIEFGSWIRNVCLCLFRSHQSVFKIAYLCQNLNIHNDSLVSACLSSLSSDYLQFVNSRMFRQLLYKTTSYHPLLSEFVQGPRRASPTLLFSCPLHCTVSSNMESDVHWQKQQYNFTEMPRVLRIMCNVDHIALKHQQNFQLNEI